VSVWPYRADHVSTGAQFKSSLNALTWVLRDALLALPVAAYTVTASVCRALHEAERDTFTGSAPNARGPLG
jgi:hypothetical protein